MPDLPISVKQAGGWTKEQMLQDRLPRPRQFVLARHAADAFQCCVEPA
jgi:hypothetical protein